MLKQVRHAKNNMLISIITAVLNSANTIEDCIKSVQSQTYKNIEHIIIDGGSTDGTLDIIKRYADTGKIKWVSKQDNGMYDAINKGIRIATGEVIGILNSDDFYAHEKVVELVMNAFENPDIDACYGDLLYVDKDNTEKIVRYWKSKPYKDGLFRYGWHPPHPTFFVKKWVYEKYGFFRTDMKIGSDYELMLRFIEGCKIRTHYISEVLVKMRMGGKSNRSLRNILLQTFEDYKAWKINGLSCGITGVFFKKMNKISQFYHRP
ncbi:MAG: glycosyltransferase family 2 protein [Verrucomicrobiia bacterium]